MGNFFGCATEEHIVLAQKAGAVGVVITSFWVYCNVKDQYSSKFNNTINAVCINSYLAQTEQFVLFLVNSLVNNVSVEIEFTLDGKNPVSKLNRGGFIFYQIIYIGVFSILMFFSFRKLIFFLQNGLPLLSIKIVVIFFTIPSNII